MLLPKLRPPPLTLVRVRPLVKRVGRLPPLRTVGSVLLSKLAWLGLGTRLRVSSLGGKTRYLKSLIGSGKAVVRPG